MGGATGVEWADPRPEWAELKSLSGRGQEVGGGGVKRPEWAEPGGVNWADPKAQGGGAREPDWGRPRARGGRSPGPRVGVASPAGPAPAAAPRCPSPPARRIPPARRPLTPPTGTCSCWGGGACQRGGGASALSPAHPRGKKGAVPPHGRHPRVRPELRLQGGHLGLRLLRLRLVVAAVTGRHLAASSLVGAGHAPLLP